MGHDFVPSAERARVAHPPTTIASVIPRYSRPAMARVWSEEAKLERWLAVELAALEAWAQVGAVPAESVAAIRSRAHAPPPERVAEIERTTNHDVAAFVDAVAEGLGPDGRWLHYGLTSSDVLDTALALAVQDAGKLVVEGVDAAQAAVVARAFEHRGTVTIGRTHGVHAEPTTFGLKLAGWAFQLERDRSRLERALDGLRVGKLSGAVGTYSSTTPEVERIACEALGLEPAPSSTQVLQRDRHAELLSALALLASSLERFALEVRHLARTEVREVEEPFTRGQKGSSAMPHKRNPIVSERICGLARVVRGYAQVGLENVALWHERDISHSSAERVVLPDAFLAVDYVLDRFGWLVRGLVIRSERMRANLEATGGLFFSQRLLLALVESGLARDEAYGLVQRHAMRAWDEGLDFRALARSDSCSRSASTSVRSSTSRRSRAMRTSCSSGCKPYDARRSMPEAVHVASGKVREIYALDDERLLLVASDRVSTFDVVLPTPIPDKGRVLTGLSAFWFARTREIVPNHLLEIRDDGRSIVCRRLEMLPIECVVRGYLAGSGWKDYRETGAVCGHVLPTGLRESERLPEPIFTPATKATEGHDENIAEDEAAALCGPDLYEQAKEASLALYAFASAHAQARGIVLADTKFELGIAPDGALVLGDEALTPDSSRFWPLEGYEPGRGQPSFDKQFVRDWCERTGWDKTPPGPELPDDVVAGTRARYVEAFELLTDTSFERYLASTESVLG